MAIAVADIGPRHVLMGIPTTALGAGMLAVGLVRNLNISESPQLKVATTETGAENHEGKFYLRTELTVEFEVARDVASGIDAFLEMVNTDGDYAALGSALPKLTLAIVHPDDAAGNAAGASAKTIWIPSVRLENTGQQGFNSDQAGTDDSNFVMLTFQAGYVATDQAGTDVPEAALPKFRGDRLATHGMGWSLPAPYGPAA